MAIAGKVAITPGGEWSVDFAYDKLVVVTFGNNVYLSIKPSTGIEPTNEEHWMLLIENVTQEQYDNIINGTTTVGNANKLGGKGASEYVLGNGVTILTALPTGITNDSTMQELINAMPTYSMLNLARAMSPLTPESYCELTVIKSTTAYVIAFAKSQYTSNVYMGGVNTVNEWDGWHKYATTADLANYLPKSGGEVNGTIYANSTGYPMVFDATATDYCLLPYKAKGTLCGHLGFNGVNNPVYADANGSPKTLLHTGNVGDYALPKSGGAIDGFVQINNASETPFVVHNSTSSTHCYVGFRAGGTELGYFGFQTGMPYVMSVNGSGVVHHDGNSAKVAIQETAPTDTTSLWVDSTNKKTKAYIDGAWTALA